MTARTTRRRLAATAAAAVVALGLAACATPVPEPQPDAAPAVPPPALSVAQSTRVLDQVGEVLAAGDAALDPAGLDARLTGPALAIRSSEYTRAQATGGERPPVTLPTTAQTTIVPDTDTWPRTQMVVTEQPADLQAPLLMVLEQAGPREPYRLWGWARLGPSVQMPLTADPTVGSEPVAADDTSLLLSPQEAVAQYADVLTNGDASAAAATFPPDFFRTALTEARNQTAASLQAVATVTETVAPEADQVTALRTADGGAIVVGQLTTVTTVALSQGSITLNDPFDAALAGKDSVTSNLVRTWTDVVALYVPPAGGGEQVQVLAAEHARTAVTGE
ncbi:hypothetical protein [Cellulomonas triticagri]|uniref:DUF8094 domain-containing protein n=1 Tax=Cellulomonas triticagri TaxID=2483352 RepID=A0A3M2IT20_9CELL|nr:hypothetical protein [Cellulomonas triticagri]RMI02393.1 hypothetical protein EBM89_20215 [Cellulomonas triticagri]